MGGDLQPSVEIDSLQVAPLAGSVEVKGHAMEVSFVLAGLLAGVWVRCVHGLGIVAGDVGTVPHGTPLALLGVGSCFCKTTKRKLFVLFAELTNTRLKSTVTTR